MLAKACPVCGCPLFEIKGETTCVVCAEKRDGDEEPAAAPMVAAPADVPRAAAAAVEAGALAAELEAALVQLAKRLSGEPDPQRCIALVQCIRTGIEALALLRH
jgi:UPF0148 protein